MLRNNYLIVDICDFILNICCCLYYFKLKCYKIGWFNFNLGGRGVIGLLILYNIILLIKKLKKGY